MRTFQAKVQRKSRPRGQKSVRPRLAVAGARALSTASQRWIVFKMQKEVPKARTKPEEPAEDGYKMGDPAAFARNMMQVGAQSQQLLGDFLKRQAGKLGTEPIDPLNLGNTFMEL